MQRTLVPLLGLTCASLFVLALLLTAFDTREAAARGGETAQPKVTSSAGEIYFDHAIRYVADGKAGIHNLTDFYADLQAVNFAVGQSRHQGHMRLWLKTPDKYRFELRERKDPRQPNQKITTKILDGGKMWIVHPDGREQRMHGTGGTSAASIRQMQDDRRRLLDLARFLTLDGLKGPGVTFHDEGFTQGSGTFAGNWIRVRRKIQGGADVLFYLAHVADPRDPRRRRATHPGIVKVEGNPATGEPTEYYLLKNWVRGPQFRYPAKILAYSEAKPGARPNLFLEANPVDVRINTGLQSSLFAPPSASPRAAQPRPGK